MLVNNYSIEKKFLQIYDRTIMVDFFKSIACFIGNLLYGHPEIYSRLLIRLHINILMDIILQNCCLYMMKHIDKDSKAFKGYPYI